MSTESEVLDRWNNAISKGASLAKDLAKTSQSSLWVTSWTLIAERLSSMRKQGNIMGQAKALSRQQVEQSLDKYEKKLGVIKE